jgi:hypothetical protein
MELIRTLIQCHQLYLVNPDFTNSHESAISACDPPWGRQSPHWMNRPGACRTLPVLTCLHARRVGSGTRFTSVLTWPGIWLPNRLGVKRGNWLIWLMAVGRAGGASAIGRLGLQHSGNFAAAAAAVAVAEGRVLYHV